MQSDLEFAKWFAESAGAQMMKFRTSTARRKKIDRTDVTDQDELLNRHFITLVRNREGNGTSVKGEEVSSMVRNAKRMWVIDPIDGTGEYVDDSMSDSRRTTCLGLSLFVEGRLVLSVVRNPFRHETFMAEAGKPTTLNGRVIGCVGSPIQRGVSYDFCHWDGAPFDMRPLVGALGKPRGAYSAIYQACTVAAGWAAFAVFPGNTIHDIAPGALLVKNAGIARRRGGLVTDLRGHALDWSQ